MNRHISSVPALLTALLMLGGCASGGDGGNNTDISQSMADVSETVTSAAESDVTESIQTETTADVNEVPEEDARPAYPSVYKELLTERLSSGNEDMAFDLYDMDSDGVCELFISEGSRSWCRTKVFSADNGILSELTNVTFSGAEHITKALGSYGTVTAYGNIIESSVCSEGREYGGIIVKSGQSLERLLRYSHTDGSAFITDGNEVTEEEYLSAAESYRRSDPVLVGRQYPLTADSVSEVFGEEIVLPEREVIPTEDCYRIFADFLLPQCAPDGDYGRAFDVFDINGDGAPELIFSEGDYHAAGAAVYAVSGGELTQLVYEENDGTVISGFGSYGEMTVSDGYIRSSLSGMSEYDSVIYRISGDTIERIADFVRTTEDDTTLTDHTDKNAAASAPSAPEFTINGIPVSEKEFTEELERFSGSDPLVLGRAHPLTIEEVGAVLGVDTASDAPLTIEETAAE